MQLFESFSEPEYLDANSDVASAVGTGQFLSGLEHYVIHGFTEDRRGVSTSFSTLFRTFVNRAVRLTPPPALRERVHGDANLEAFENAGRIAAFHLAFHLRKSSGCFHFEQVLDFGCGCGRISKYLPLSLGFDSLSGVDVDKESIDWCRRSLGGIARFVSCETTPPLPFDDGCFNLVYAVSVFTHLPQKLQFIWLEEIRRVLSPGGFVLISTHGPALLSKYDPSAVQEFLDQGFHFQTLSRAKGLPCYYQTSYHSKEYISENWSSFFEIVGIVQRGVLHHQDLVIMRRTS